MGVKRPLKPEVAKKYGRELAIAEQMAEQGFDPKTKKLDESIYGPTSMQFDPLQEMQELAKNNITDNSFMEASMKEWEKTEESSASLEEAAVQAVMNQQAESVPSAPAIPEAQPAQAQEDDSEALSEDPEERLKQVANKLKDIVGKSAPTYEQMKQWKMYHGDVFLLQLDTKIFIYRYLKRQEWVQMQANEAIQKLRPDQYEDMLFAKCILWPQMSPQSLAGLPAGAITTVVEQIRLQSMFLDPMQVASATIKL